LAVRFNTFITSVIYLRLVDEFLQSEQMQRRDRQWNCHI